MTSERLGEMFEGDSADTCAWKFPLVTMGGLAEGLACADPGARTPIGASGNFPAPVSAEGPSAFKTVKIGYFGGQFKNCPRVTKFCMGS